MNDKIFRTLEYNKIIFKLMQHTSTEVGSEVAEKLQPSTHLDEVKIRLQTTDEACAVLRLRGQVPFGGIRNNKEALKRAKIGGVLESKQLLDIADTVQGSRRLQRFLSQFQQNEEVNIEQLLTYSEQISSQKQLEDEIRMCIDDQANVMDNASQKLASVRRDLRVGEGRIRERLERMVRTSSVQKMLQETIVTMRNDRYVLPVKQEYRSSFGGIIHDQSASGATLFIEPESVVQLNNQLKELQAQEEQEMFKILTRLSNEVALQAEELQLDLDLVAQLDFIFAKAYLAYELKATLPRMNDRGYLKLKQARHPIIPAEIVVPTDVELGNDYTTIIITGPNTGGKTVTLKTIGLLSLMAMSGLFIPAEDGSQMCVFDAIYADIGDEQSIEQNLSTFSSHLTNIIDILERMTPKSLLLFDELGAGTDPAEGSALAISILEYVHQKQSRIVATTHYSELKAYAYNRQGIINASMEFDLKTLSPTYKLLLGVPGRSNAFAIAERLGLSESILAHARNYVSEEDHQVESMISTLEEQRVLANEAKEEALRLKHEAEETLQRHRKKVADFESKRQKLLEKAGEEANEAVKKARLEAETIIADLRKMALDEATSIKEHKLIEARRRLDTAAPSFTDSPYENTPKQVDRNKLKIGDEIRVTSINQKGTILEPPSEEEVLVQLGIMKMKVNISDIELVRQSSQQQMKSNGTTMFKRRKEHGKSELDLRGVNLEEAYQLVDQFLDDALLANYKQVQIIHGKGTGVLRQGIQEFLKKHKYIKQFRLGAYGEGGSGVTIAELEG